MKRVIALLLAGLLLVLFVSCTPAANPDTGSGKTPIENDPLQDQPGGSDPSGENPGNPDGPGEDLDNGEGDGWTKLY